MGVLKIRDENGKVHTITTFKGDKGEPGKDGKNGVGVPDGGNVGQVMKKTADGTGWGDIFDKDPPLLSNTENDTTITSVGITQIGLYDIKVRVFTQTKSDGTGTYSPFYRAVMSISDLGDSFDREIYCEIRVDSSGDVKESSLYRCYLRYADGTISVRYGYSNGSSSSSLDFPYLSEVRLIMSYD